MDSRSFKKKVYAHYCANARCLPWRETANPYRVLVSEIMLQQTQAERVVVFYKKFIARFPDVQTLARARQRSVVRAWRGLGYNRRALMLHRLAKEITSRYNGRVPRSPGALSLLPGIGPATAGSICAFAFNRPAVFIETNIRSVFIYEFFKGKQSVHDKDILPLIEKTLDKKNPREWYWALMDYGVYLKKNGKNPSTRSAHYVVQKKFHGSMRQLRGNILRALLARPRTLNELAQELNCAHGRLEHALDGLSSEGFLRKKGRVLFLP